MLTAGQIDQAAHHLLAARKADKPGPSMPEEYRPMDADSALAIQERVLELLNETAGGWKAAIAPPGAGPILAPIPKSAILRSSPCVAYGGKTQIEPEIAFVMTQGLPARTTPYSDAEIRAAISEARMVLELITTRYTDKASATRSEILADAYNNHALLIGPAIPNVFDHALDKLHVTIKADGGTLFDKVHPHPSGDPMKPLTWLVHFLNGRGRGLAAGEIVTTGSYAGAVDVPLKTPFRVQLGTLGVMEAELITGGP